MQMSAGMVKTLRKVGRTVTSRTEELLLRAGVTHEPEAGRVTLTTVGVRVLRSMQAQLRKVFEAHGGQQISPAQLRLDTADFALRPSPAAPHGAVLSLLATFVQSYRELPCVLYAFSHCLKAAPAPDKRVFLTRAAEFEAAHLWCAAASAEAMRTRSAQLHESLKTVLQDWGVADRLQILRATLPDGVVRDGFFILTESGPQTLVGCPQCGWCQDQRWAAVPSAQKPTAPAQGSVHPPPQEVATPATKTIEALAELLDVAAAKCLKCVFYATAQSGRLVVAVIRGDWEVNLPKLERVVATAQGRRGGQRLCKATDATVQKAGMVPGFASPIGVDPHVCVVCDHSVDPAALYVAGANRTDFHLRNVAPGRDFPKHTVYADIALAAPACTQCPQCGGTIRVQPALEVAKIEDWSTVDLKRYHVRFNDRQGKNAPVVLGHVAVGFSRLLAAVVETHSDTQGLVWPPSLAPWDVHLLRIGKQTKDLDHALVQLHDALKEGGLRVLVDDRKESPGVKFNDADLLGLPIRVVVSQRNLKQQAVEIKFRTEAEKQLVAVVDAPQVIATQLAAYGAAGGPVGRA
jgi:prolyl-tRNA synthetase